MYDVTRNALNSGWQLGVGTHLRQRLTADEEAAVQRSEVRPSWRWPALPRLSFDFDLRFARLRLSLR